LSERTYNTPYLRTQKKPDVFPDCEKSVSSAADTLILGLGNPLRGDDGVGITVLEKLIDSYALPKNITCHQCSRGGLLDELLSEHYQQVIIIDAVKMGVSPGTWIRFQLPHTEVTSLKFESCRTPHDINLAEVIALGEALNLLPREIVVYGIQPQEAGWGPTLSKPVQIAMEKVKNVILEELSDR
jgi:hydrogenase maturation protease